MAESVAAIIPYQKDSYFYKSKHQDCTAAILETQWYQVVRKLRVSVLVCIYEEQ